MRCRDKIRYNSRDAAQRCADEMHATYALTFNPITPYKCERHACWHVGHDAYFPRELAIQYAVSAAARHTQLCNPIYISYSDTWAIYSDNTVFA